MVNVSKTRKTAPMHRIPTGLRMALRSEATTQLAWEDLTPLARNEWICWVISAKQATKAKAESEGTRYQTLINRT